MAEIVRDLRAEGWDDEAIALELEEAARLAEPGLIWPENWPIAQVFERCKWTVQTGMYKPWYTGIEAIEIASVCDLLRIPEADRAEVLDGVLLMARAAAPIYNTDHS